MLTHDRSKRKAASLCHESLRYILYIIWGSLTNLKIAFFLHQRYTKLHHSKVWNIQTREMNTAFSSHNVTGFKGYLPRSPSSYPVRVVWNDNEAEIIYMLSTRGAKRGSNYIYFRFQSLSLPLSMVTRNFGPMAMKDKVEAEQLLCQLTLRSLSFVHLNSHDKYARSNTTRGQLLSRHVPCNYVTLG